MNGAQVSRTKTWTTVELGSKGVSCCLFSICTKPQELVGLEGKAGLMPGHKESNMLKGFGRRHGDRL